MMNVKNRRIEILKLLNQSNNVFIPDLSKHFNISEMTLRRDLDTLAKKGMVKRIRGGAIKVNQGSYEVPYDLRREKEHLAKEKIAKKASELISDGETVALDTGTTAYTVAEYLQDHSNLTILTSSLRIAWLLSDKANLKVIVMGGLVRNGERSLVGEIAENAYENLFPDSFIMGVGGVDIENGFTEFDVDDARVKKKALRAAGRTIVVADQTKIGKTAFAKIASINDIDTLITDLSDQSPIVRALKQKKLAVISV